MRVRSVYQGTLSISQVIASLRRELENLQQETQAAKDSAANEAKRVEKIQLEVVRLRCAQQSNMVCIKPKILYHILYQETYIQNARTAGKKDDNWKLLSFFWER